MKVLLQPKICKNARVTNEHISLDFKFQLKIKLHAHHRIKMDF